MTDWVRVSWRTLGYAVVAIALWAVGTIAGLASTAVADTFDNICNVALLGMFGLSIAMLAWSALQCPPRSLLRRGWLIVAIGFTTGFATVAVMLASAGPGEYTFTGASLGITVALVLGGLGLCVAAASTLGAPRRGWSLAGAAVLSTFVFIVMATALLAPGPAMPFSVGARDPQAIRRLLVDAWLMLFPVAFATLAQLRLPQAHRARAWMWASVGALLMCMGDVASPLVDLGHGQIYPTMMWCMGIILLTVSASLMADFERAERGLDAATSAAGAPQVAQIDSQRFTTE
jgi:hypothetical protein